MQESGACWEAIPNIWAGQIRLSSLPLPQQSQILRWRWNFTLELGRIQGSGYRLPYGLMVPVPARALGGAGRCWPPRAHGLRGCTHAGGEGESNELYPLLSFLINTTYKLLLLIKFPQLFPQFSPCSGLCKALKAPSLHPPWSPKRPHHTHGTVESSQFLPVPQGRHCLSSGVSPEYRDLKDWIQFHHQTPPASASCWRLC